MDFVEVFMLPDWNKVIEFWVSLHTLTLLFGRQEGHLTWNILSSRQR